MDFVDIDIFNSLKSFSKDRYKKLLTSFVDGSDKYIFSMKEAASLNDLKAINFAVHSLKSSSALLGFVSLAELCNEIEEKTDDEASNLSDVEESLGEIHNIYDQVRAFVIEQIGLIKDSSNSN